MCFAIAGPGSTNMPTGLYDARLDSAPAAHLLLVRDITPVSYLFQDRSCKITRQVAVYISAQRWPYVCSLRREYTAAAPSTEFPGWTSKCQA